MAVVEAKTRQLLEVGEDVQVAEAHRRGWGRWQRRRMRAVVRLMRMAWAVMVTAIVTMVVLMLMSDVHEGVADVGR